MTKDSRSIVSRLSHVEVVHDNPAAAAAFMRDVLGAVQVEQGITSWLNKTLDLGAIHMLCGGVVYQLLKPNHYLPSWQKLLQREGPAIHNISIQVNDTEKFRAAMKSHGVEEISAAKVDFNELGFNVDGPPADAFNFDTSRHCGFRLEVLPTIPQWVPGEQE